MSDFNIKDHKWDDVSISVDGDEYIEGGKVFFIFSVKSTGKKKKIFNVEVIDEIKTEIARLESSN